MARYGVLVLVLGAAGCTVLDLGDGTMERDGECVPGDATFDPTVCGPGTVFDFVAAMCVPEYPPTVCDELTTATEQRADGVYVCVGDAPAGCAGSLACPTPDPGKVSVCGRLIDIETHTDVAVDGAVGIRCDPLAPSASGPCSLRVQIFDALTFAEDPDGATPLPVDELILDECGRYSAHNIPAPALGFLGIAVDDHPASGTDAHVLTGVAIPASGGLVERGLDTFVTRRATDELWTASAGNPFGSSTFSEVGVYFALFLNDGQPVEGASVTRAGNDIGSDGFYFDDTDPWTRTGANGALTATGPNGAALVINSNLVNHSGSGGEPAGCQWEESLAASIPGVVFAQERLLEPCQ